MVQVQTKPYDASKMSEDKRVKETPGGRTPKPEVPTVRYEWPGQAVGPGSDILIYKPSQRRPGELPPSVQTVPAIWLPSPQGGPWQYNGLNEDTLAVKKFNYMTSNSNDNDDAPVSQHIHEHHHYAHRYPIPNQAKPVRFERHGYLVKVDATGTVTAPPLPIPNQDTMFRPHSQRPIENGPYYPPYGQHFSNCPYYTEYPNAYPQQQVVPYSEVNAIDQHYHIHQHYYHPHYHYQSLKYQQSQFSQPQQPRFVAHQQPRFHTHQHTAQFPYQTRPYFAYNEGFNWFSQGPFPRPSYVQNEYDLSALKEVLRTL